MPRLLPNQTPPEGYYAENLNAVIRTVRDQYVDLLTVEESRFADSTLALSTSALRLLARLLSRTKRYIRIDSLSYADVPNVSEALVELNDAGLISIDTEGDCVEILGLLTVAELKTTFAQQEVRGRKAELVNGIRSLLEDDVIRDVVSAHHPWLRVTASEPFEIFCLLFFGNSVQKLDEFVIRDLGVTHFESYQMDPAFRMFENRRAIDRYLELNALAELVDTLGKTVSVLEANTIFSAIKTRDRDRLLELRRSRVLNALGRNLERASEFEFALRCYRHSSTHPARERTMRIQKKEGRIEEVERVRNEILELPLTYEEYAFALRFGKPRLPQPEIKVRKDIAPALGNQRIEAIAVQRLTKERCQAWHLENQLPNALFALAYWEWLYASVRGAFVNPFQATPLDLYWPEFFDVRRDICVDPLLNPSELKNRILTTARMKRGINSHLVAWSILTLDLLGAILNAMTTDQLVGLLKVVIDDVRQFRAGFPDLTVIDENGEIVFVEIKGPGDQLRPNQRLWIERLMKANFNVYVWKFS